MKNAVLLLLIAFSTVTLVFGQTGTTTSASSFNPTIKMKGLLHARYEASLTDSVDAQGKITPTPVYSNFRIRRAELRADIKLNDRWSGVIRVQLPELKSTGTTFGKVIELAYFEYKYADQLSVRGGQFKEPFEFDELTSHEDLRMIDRGPTSRLFVSNYYSSYNPGLMVFGTFLKKTTPLTYYAGVFNGSDRSLNYDLNFGKDYVGRVEFSPIQSLRFAINGQLNSIEKGVTAGAAGADVSLQQPLGDHLKLILEGEYIGGNNNVKYSSDTDSSKEMKNFMMNGYFAQALLRYHVDVPGLQTFEIGGKFEHTNPLVTNDEGAYNTITGGIGFIFVPDNDARLQLNVVHTNYKEEISGSQKNNTMFVAQLQLKI
ncbi:MAG: hypothetical protein IPO83_14965 [Chitinophagaceae bacterium]|nr:hypothetical protein [Chitinophagaceae bacterium]